MPLWLAAAPLVLASRSAVRRTLREAAGIAVEICPADIDERGVEAGAPLKAPVAIAALLAREKASVISFIIDVMLGEGRDILGVFQGRYRTHAETAAIGAASLHRQLIRWPEVVFRIVARGAGNLPGS